MGKSNLIIWGKPNLDPNGEIVVHKKATKDGLFDMFFDPEPTEVGSNEIYFWKDVSDHSVMNLISELRRISSGIMNKSIDADHIRVYVNSYGGDLLAGFNAYDEIVNINRKIPVYTIVDGKSASASTFINMAGAKRYIKPNSFMLIHQLSSISMGKHSEMEDHSKNMNMFMNRIKSIYLGRGNFEKKQLDEILKHDIWIDAQQSKDYGLVDEIA